MTADRKHRKHFDWCLKGGRNNLMSALLAKEQGLEINPLLKLLAEGVNRSKLLVYSTTTAEVNITDS
jgi:hypothetical protein